MKRPMMIGMNLTNTGREVSEQIPWSLGFLLFVVARVESGEKPKRSTRFQKPCAVRE